ncbi:TIGR01777 family protein [Ornithinimicrobium avium]|uniref:TIGR01777 family protein n=2 Tax=Ornithinimicrobium avium TaxID=2283195 RepID=A0A345NSD8_9MICO|nr:TIGR01777 family protein [Ornithinimicrobium avium]
MIGSALSEELRGRGDQVLHLVRRAPRASGDPQLPPGVREARWEPGVRLDPAVLDGVEGVVHLAGAGIGDHRWTAARKRLLMSSRLEGTETISLAVAALPAGSRPRLLSASAVGFYGDQGTDLLTEESGHGQGFLAELCREWENATWPAEHAGASVAHLRTGIVLSPHGGAIARIMPLAKAGLAGPLGRGDQYWSWITLHDHVRAVVFLLDHPSLTGPVNLTGPDPATQTAVVKTLAEKLNRPAIVPAPTVALRLVLGEMAGEILTSQRALPTVLRHAGFGWDHSELGVAMEWLTTQRKRAKKAG